MRVIRDCSSVTSDVRGAVAAIGNFDGVHRGHQLVIDLAGLKAAETEAKLGVITFEPHPRQFFAPNSPPFRLLSNAARAEQLAAIGVDVLFELEFDRDLANLHSNEFSRSILGEGLGISHCVVGENFRYGKGREGDAGSLVAEGKAYGFGVSIKSVSGDSQGVFSSSLIRDAISAGKPQEAARMLGHWHKLRGVIEKGDRRGRQLGFPTANISLAGLLSPKFGVYAVLVEILSGPHKGIYQGCASIGVRPTFGENTPNLEVFIFGFDADIYGEAMLVSLISYQRPELKFETPEGLVQQMASDCDVSRKTLESIAFD